jgi:hypothetical protein
MFTDTAQAGLRATVVKLSKMSDQLTRDAAAASFDTATLSRIITGSSDLSESLRVMQATMSDNPPTLPPLLIEDLMRRVGESLRNTPAMVDRLIDAYKTTVETGISEGDLRAEAFVKLEERVSEAKSTGKVWNPDSITGSA